MKIAVVGSGGQGIFFGTLLANSGNDVTFIARGKTLEALKTRGVELKSKTLGKIKLPAEATDNPGEVGPVDLIMLCVKYYDVKAASEQMKPMISEDTMILPVINWIDVAEKVGKIVGLEHLICGVSWVNTAVESPGVVNHGGVARLIFGELEGGESSRVKRLESTLKDARITAELSRDIGKEKWEKFTINSAISSVMALTRLPTGPLRGNPETQALLRRAIEESVAVAEAYGHFYPEGFVDGVLKMFENYAPWSKAALLQDLEAGRRLELGALTRALVRLGREKGVPIPLSDVVYAVLKPYEDGAVVVSRQ
jgi:2-dehydropantoate 2-reductase